MASVTLCLWSLCPRSERKTAPAINTKRGTHMLYGRTSANIDPEVKKSRSRGYENHHCRTVQIKCAADAGVGLHVIRLLRFLVFSSGHLCERLFGQKQMIRMPPKFERHPVVPATSAAARVSFLRHARLRVITQPIWPGTRGPRLKSPTADT